MRVVITPCERVAAATQLQAFPRTLRPCQVLGLNSMPKAVLRVAVLLLERSYAAWEPDIRGNWSAT